MHMKKYKLEATAIIRIEGREEVRTPVTINFEADNILDANYEGFRLCKEATLCWNYDGPVEVGGLDEAEKRLAVIVRELGEKDDNVRRIWLDLNGACDIEGHTDIMCAHYGEDGMLTFQVNTPDDSSTIFVSFGELPEAARNAVMFQIFYHA